MKCSRESESERRKRRVSNIVELGDGALVYIRLNDGKKYLLNGDGCWRCGSTAKCFGNMDGNELEMVCEFDFFDEVRSLFLVLLQDWRVKWMTKMKERVNVRVRSLLESSADLFRKMIKHVNVKKR